jgi:hypothetical protein
VAYVDNDPMVLAYATELLSDDGTTTVISADLRDVRGADDPALADSDGSHWWYGGVARRP